MIQTTHIEASERIALFAREGRLLQGRWHKMNGVERACLLGAIHSKINNEKDCPAELMPPWMARLTVTLFDGIREERAQEYGLRYAEAMKRWATFTPDQWKAALTNVLIYCIDSAVDSARPVCEGKVYWPKVAEACATVTRLLREGAPKAELRAAYAAANAAANAAYANAAANAYAADAADAAYAAAAAANAAAYAAADANAYAADAAYAAANAAAAKNKQRKQVCERIFDFVLSQFAEPTS